MKSDPVRVPEDVGLGMAKITLSIQGGKVANAVPAFFELPVLDAAPKPKKE
jgi:hypothetical protein